MKIHLIKFISKLRYLEQFKNMSDNIIIHLFHEIRFDK